MESAIKRAEKVKNRYAEQWLGINGVTAIGIGKVEDKVSIIISVDRNRELIETQIPVQVEGIPVKIKQTGRIVAL
jgi:hypothetical protein